MLLDHPCLKSEIGVRERRRGRRVILLVAAIVMLSLGDLYATLTHASSIGMVELNPIGAYLIQSGSPNGLILFKCGSILLTATLLLVVRHYLTGELGGWVCLFVMVGLTIHWYNYNHAIEAEAADLHYHEIPGMVTLAEAHR